MGIIINLNSDIISEIHTKPLEKAMGNLKRDIQNVCTNTKNNGSAIVLKKGNQQKEGFSISCEDGKLIIEAGDDLGFIYGIYKVSRSILGIKNFWFWNDQQFEKHMEYEIEDNWRYQSVPYWVKFRGWFVNDEVLLSTWSVNRRKEEPWEMVFEALLRQGGNMVIPGTDANSERYRDLASDMGLYITHHHAEPLGARMFARAYPDLVPSYEEHGSKFRTLWQEGIDHQKDMDIIWNLGFRGQGDIPFWESDPRYTTPKSRGELMSRLIQIQYDMVKAADSKAICCTNLYGETMELYKEGYLELPGDVIKVWADNGYGKMVTRRQGNHNPRVYSLPEKKDSGRHGIYYHASFYDLQAANHMTMCPNSLEFIRRELTEVLDHGADDFWIINCSNVKPHVYVLDYLAKMWRDGDVEPLVHTREYAEEYYGKKDGKKIEKSFTLYPEYALSFGKEEDEHAGEQYSNHVARMLVSQYMKDSKNRGEDLLWMGEYKTLKEQIEGYLVQCEQAANGYEEYEKICQRIMTELEDSTLFQDSILLQVKIHARCYRGAAYVSEGLLKAMNEDYKKAFYLAGKAREAYGAADDAMRNREHGKWHNFYENECLTDIKQTAWVLEGLMSYLRNLGDGPHFYQWQRDFLYAEEDRRVVLLTNMENHLRDLELYNLMKEKWE